jgi:hypothetical protein
MGKEGGERKRKKKRKIEEEKGKRRVKNANSREGNKR